MQEENKTNKNHNVRGANDLAWCNTTEWRKQSKRSPEKSSSLVRFSTFVRPMSSCLSRGSNRTAVWCRLSRPAGARTVRRWNPFGRDSIRWEFGAWRRCEKPTEWPCWDERGSRMRCCRGSKAERASWPYDKKTLIESINQSINQPINQSFNQSIDRPRDQSINQSIEWTINRPINQAINQSDELLIERLRIPNIFKLLDKIEKN